MKKPVNENYAALIAKIDNIIPIEKADKIKSAIILGNSVIVDETAKIGDIVVYFPVECQLSSDYLCNNNLYRNTLLNHDSTKKGYFDDNGRVKCIKLRGAKSEGIIMPLSSFNYISNKLEFNIGDSFDELEGINICKKYVIKEKRSSGTKNTQGKKPKVSKIVDNQFRFHDDTSQLFRNLHRVKPESLIQISYKIHGTSSISSKILCKRKLNWIEKLLKTVGVKIVDSEYDYIYSSRTVIKNDDKNNKPFDKIYKSLKTSSKKRYVENYYRFKYASEISNELYRKIFPLENEDNSIFTLNYFESFLPGFTQYLLEKIGNKKKGYYGTDIWGIADSVLRPFLQNGMSIYYEIAGYLPSGGMIQKNYDYGCIPPISETEFYEGVHYKIFIYRITYTNISGKVFEFSGRQVQDFCTLNGLRAVPELYYGRANEVIYAGFNEISTVEDWSNMFLNEIKRLFNDKDCYLCNNVLPEEGCVIRIEDGLQFEAYKQKSFRFLEKETNTLNLGESNIEDEN